MESRLLKNVCMAAVAIVLFQGGRVKLDKVKTTLQAVEEHAVPGTKSTCTLAEKANPDRDSQVAYGIQLKFPTNKCRASCNVIKIISETIPNKYIEGKSIHGDNVCSCYSRIPSNADAGKFLFAFAPQTTIQDDECNGKNCWKRYKDMAGWAKMREFAKMKEMGGKLMGPDDSIDSANHYTTEDPKCGGETPDLEVFDITSMGAITAELKKNGDHKDTVKTLGKWAIIEDPKNEELKIEELKKESESIVVIQTTTAEGAGIGDDDFEGVNSFSGLSDEEIEKLSEEEFEAKMNENVAAKAEVVSPVASSTVVNVVHLAESAEAEMTSQLVQPVVLSSSQGVCSKGADKYKKYTVSECGPIQTEEECRAVAQNPVVTKGVVGQFTAFDNKDIEAKGCGLRRTKGGAWHGYWNGAVGAKEKQAKAKGRGAGAVESRLLCGCYRMLPKPAADQASWF